MHTAQTLYGKQLAVNIDKTGIDTILDKYLCYYPKQFRFLLKERIETVLMEQQKKLFEKQKLLRPVKKEGNINTEQDTERREG